MRIHFKVSTPIAFGRHALVNIHLKAPAFFPFLFTGIQMAAALKSSLACL